MKHHLYKILLITNIFTSCVFMGSEMLKELIREEVAALEEFETFLKSNRPSKIIKNDPFEPAAHELLVELVEASHGALKECQLIESLDRQLRLLSETQGALIRLKSINELNEKILKCKNLSELVPLVLQWRKEQQKSEQFEQDLSENGAQTAEFVNVRLPEMIDGEIERVLSGWNDSPESRDKESLTRLAPFLRPESTNPLQPLFAGFPLTKLRTLLNVHCQLGNLQRVQKTFPDRLLNRFYALLSNSDRHQQQQKEEEEAFSVGQIESLVPEKMKFATRISCILEATNYFIKLIDNELIPNFEIILMTKCCQIVKQIRKSAKESRAGYTISNNSVNAAAIDAQLNEICLIMTTISEFIQAHPQCEELKIELDKWKSIQNYLEEGYLAKGIQRAIEMDQIVTGDTTVDFPVSSCVDDIFYVLQASKSRAKQIKGNFALLPRALNEFFLSVLRKHLEMTVESLKPINLDGSTSTYKPSRDLISTLVLVNNLVATRSNWAAFSSDLPESDSSNVKIVDESLQKLFNYALRDGLHDKLLQNSIKKELQLVGGDGEGLFIKIHSLIQIIHNLFKPTLAKAALDELIGLSIGGFSQIFCKQILFDDRNSANLSTTVALRYDRLLHELSQWLEGPLNLQTPPIGLLRLKQAVSLLLTDSREEAQQLVDEWKEENSCQLRAGEILLIMNKKNKKEINK